MNSFQRCIVITTAMVSALYLSAAAQVDEQTRTSIEELVTGLVEDGAPGVAVGVVSGSEVVLETYAGLANLDVPTTIGPQSRFNIASNAKQFTALMILELEEKGELDLSKDFRTYLTDAMPEIEETVTVGQLLSHRSGIRDIYDLWALTGVTWYERPFRNRDVMALLNRQTDLNFAPGSDYLYSNSNYILLAELIAEVTDTPFHEYAEKFFDARGMENTIVRRRYGVVIPDLARAYGNWSGWLEDPAIANMHGDGFLYSTLPDQLRWEAQVWGHKPSLSTELISLSQQPISAASGDYGFGLEFGEYKGLPVRYHVGSTGGYNAYTLRFPTLRASIVVIGNTTDIGVVGLGQEIADRLFAEEFTSEASYPAGPDELAEIERLDDYLGLYELDSGTFMRIVLRDGDLFREIEGRDPVRLLPDEKNVFSYETNPDLKLAFTTAADGSRGFVIYAPFQAPQSARAIVPAPVGDRYRQRLEGTFVNAETDTEIVLKQVDGDNFAMIKNGRERNAQLVGEDYLIWNNYRFRVVRENGRQATGLLVDNNRIRNVVFDRVD